MRTPARSRRPSSSSRQRSTGAICDDNNDANGDRPTARRGTVLTEGGTYSGGVADVQPVYDFLGDTYNFYNSRWTRDSIDGAGHGAQGRRFAGARTRRTRTRRPPPPTIFQDAVPATTNAFFAPFTPATASQMYYRPGRRLRRHHGPRDHPRRHPVRVGARLPERVRGDQRVALRRLRRVDRPRQRDRDRHRRDALADRRGQLARA